MSPEEVYAAVCVSSGSNVSPCDWLKSEQPHLLDEICAKAASVQQDYKTEHAGPQLELQNPADQLGDVQFSRAEARQSWVAAQGDTERAVQHMLRTRRAKVRAGPGMAKKTGKAFQPKGQSSINSYKFLGVHMGYK